MVNLILTMNFKNYIADIFDFVLKRVLELMGIILIFLSILLGIALGSYSPDDPNFIFRENLEIKNLLGKKGSFISDFLMQAFGLISIFVPITIFFTGLNIFKSKKIILIINNFFYISIYLLFGCLFVSLYYNDSFWLLINGNGGFLGNYLANSIIGKLFLFNEKISYYILIIIFFLFF